MTKQLYIHWEYEGGKGNTSPKPVSEKENLEAWRDALQRAYPEGVFSVEVKPSTNIIRTTRDLVREFV